MIGRRTVRGPRDPRARIAILSLVWVLLGCVLTAALCFIPLFIAFSGPAERAAEHVHVVDEILALDRHLWKIALGMATAILGPIAILHRKTTGTMVRFCRVFEQVGQGSIPRSFSIRENDYLHAEADAFAKMLAELGERANAIADARDALSLEIKLLAREIAREPSADRHPWEARIQQLEGLDKELADAVSGIAREA